MSKNKGFLAVVLVIILAVLVGGGYAMWQKQIVAPIDTSGWIKQVEQPSKFSDFRISVLYPPGVDPYVTLGGASPLQFALHRIVPERLHPLDPDYFNVKEYDNNLAEVIADIQQRFGSSIIAGRVFVGNQQGYEIRFNTGVEVWLQAEDKRDGVVFLSFAGKKQLEELDKKILQTAEIFYHTKTPVTKEITEIIGTSNWKTYRNEEYGFEIKYPPEWMVETKKFGIVQFRTSLVSGGLTIYTAKIPEEQTLDKHLESIDDNICEGVPCRKVLNKKEIIVAGYPAIQRRESWADCPCTGQATYFRRGNLVYVFSGAPINSDSITGEEEIMYNKILSTFRFTR